MVREIGFRQKEFLKKKESQEQRKLGQYYTDAPIAEYMSSLIDNTQLDKENVNILDCGAGYGVLTASTALYCLKSNIQKVHATLFEIDPTVLKVLRNTMDSIVSAFNKEKKKFTYEIISKDFVIERPDLNLDLKFDISVINPPYFKYSVKKSPYAKVTADLYKGDPNIYASFIAIMISALNLDGQAVVISPRSFLNGLYFKGFRKFLLSNTDIQKIHIFKSRAKVFLDSEVLQENIIFKINKSRSQSRNIIISASLGTSDLSESKIEKYPNKIIVDKSNDENIIRIPETKEGYEILCKAESLPSTFTNEGYFISTGPVVEHRVKNYLSSQHYNNSVPLIRTHNVFTNGIKWDGKHPKDLSFQLLDQHEKHLSNNTKYVILKRFTAKNEKRRLVAGVYNQVINESKLIGITNKLNYIGLKDEDIEDLEAIGLAALFNSTFMDNYYRCISGNTQVNATDIRILKFPTRENIVSVGKKINDLVNADIEKIDYIINELLSI